MGTAGGLKPKDDGGDHKSSPLSDDALNLLLDTIHGTQPKALHSEGKSGELQSIVTKAGQAHDEIVSQQSPKEKLDKSQAMEVKPIVLAQQFDQTVVNAATGNKPEKIEKPETSDKANKPAKEEEQSSVLDLAIDFAGGVKKVAVSTFEAAKAMTINQERVDQLFAGKKERDIEGSANNISNIIVNNAAVAAHPTQVVEAVGAAIEKTKDVYSHGTAAEKAEKSGEIVGIGLTIFAGGTLLGRSGAHEASLATARQGMSKAGQASSTLGDFKASLKAGNPETVLTRIPEGLAQTPKALGHAPDKVVASTPGLGTQLDNILGENTALAKASKGGSLATRVDGLTVGIGPRLGHDAQVNVFSGSPVPALARFEVPTSVQNFAGKLAERVDDLTERLKNRVKGTQVEEALSTHSLAVQPRVAEIGGHQTGTVRQGKVDSESAPVMKSDVVPGEELKVAVIPGKEQLAAADVGTGVGVEVEVRVSKPVVNENHTASQASTPEVSGAGEPGVKKPVASENSASEAQAKLKVELPDGSNTTAVKEHGTTVPIPGHKPPVPPEFQQSHVSVGGDATAKKLISQDGAASEVKPTVREAAPDVPKGLKEEKVVQSDKLQVENVVGNEPVAVPEVQVVKPGHQGVEFEAVTPVPQHVDNAVGKNVVANEPVAVLESKGVKTEHQGVGKVEAAAPVQQHVDNTAGKHVAANEPVTVPEAPVVKSGHQGVEVQAATPVQQHVDNTAGKNVVANESVAVPEAPVVKSGHQGFEKAEIATPVHQQVDTAAGKNVVAGEQVVVPEVGQVTKTGHQGVEVETATPVQQHVDTAAGKNVVAGEPVAVPKVEVVKPGHHGVEAEIAAPVQQHVDNAAGKNVAAKEPVTVPEAPVVKTGHQGIEKVEAAAPVQEHVDNAAGKSVVAKEPVAVPEAPVVKFGHQGFEKAETATPVHEQVDKAAGKNVVAGKQVAVPEAPVTKIGHEGVEAGNATPVQQYVDNTAGKNVVANEPVVVPEASVVKTGNQGVEAETATPVHEPVDKAAGKNVVAGEQVVVPEVGQVTKTGHQGFEKAEIATPVHQQLDNTAGKNVVANEPVAVPEASVVKTGHKGVEVEATTPVHQQLDNTAGKNVVANEPVAVPEASVVKTGHKGVEVEATTPVQQHVDIAATPIGLSEPGSPKPIVIDKVADGQSVVPMRQDLDNVSAKVVVDTPEVLVSKPVAVDSPIAGKSVESPASAHHLEVADNKKVAADVPEITGLEPLPGKVVAGEHKLESPVPSHQVNNGEVKAVASDAQSKSQAARSGEVHSAGADSKPVVAQEQVRVVHEPEISDHVAKGNTHHQSRLQEADTADSAAKPVIAQEADLVSNSKLQGVEHAPSHRELAKEGALNSEPVLKSKNVGNDAIQDVTPSASIAVDTQQFNRLQEVKHLEVQTQARRQMQSLAQFENALKDVELPVSFKNTLEGMKSSLREISEDGLVLTKAENLQTAINKLEKEIPAQVLLERPHLAEAFAELKNQAVKLEQNLGHVESLNAFKVAAREEGEVIARQAGQMTQQAQKLGQIVDEVGQTAGLKHLLGSDSTVGQLKHSLSQLDEALKAQSKLGTVAGNHRIQELVRELDKPEYSKFFADHPQASKLVTELKESAVSVSKATEKVENIALTVEKIQAVENVTQAVSVTTAKVDALLAGHPELAIPGVVEDLQQLNRRLSVSDAWAVTPESMKLFRDTLERFESKGAQNIARTLRTEFEQLEAGLAKATQIGRVENLSSIFQTHSTNVATLSLDLAKTLEKDANLAPSIGARISKEAQVREHFELIGRQMRNLSESGDNLQAITRVKDSLAKIEELGGAKILGPARIQALNDLKVAVEKVDLALVEKRGLATFDHQSLNLKQDADLMLDLSARIKAQPEIQSNILAKNHLAAITKAGEDLKTVGSVTDQARALRTIRDSLDEPAVRRILEKTDDGQQLLNQMHHATQRTEVAVRYRALEQSLGVLERKTDDLLLAAGKLQGEPTLLKGIERRQFSQDIEKYLEICQTLQTRPLERMQIIQDLERQMRQMEAHFPQGQEVQAIRELKQVHAEVLTQAREVHEVARGIIERKMGQVDTYLAQISVAASSKSRRDIITFAGDEIQDIRFLEKLTVANAGGKLATAQRDLMAAANDLEVAAYRRNLVLLAKEGNREALDKLLLSGLTSNGHRIYSLGDTLAFVRQAWGDKVISRISILPLVGTQEGRSIFRLAINDPIFANNRNAVLSPKIWQNAGSGTIATGFSGFAAAVYDNNTRGRDMSESSEDLGTHAVQSVAFAQILMRQAAAAEKLTPAIGIDSMAKPIQTVYYGAHQLRRDDPDFERKKFYLATYGQLFAPVKGAEEVEAQPQGRVVFPQAGINFRRSRSSAEGMANYEKPASSSFVLPQALALSNPKLLLQSAMVLRGPAAANLSSQQMAIFNSQLGRLGAGVSPDVNLQHIEATESTGVDLNGGAMGNAVPATAVASSNVASASSLQDEEPVNSKPRLLAGPPKKRNRQEV